MRAGEINAKLTREAKDIYNILPGPKNRWISEAIIEKHQREQLVKGSTVKHTLEVIEGTLENHIKLIIALEDRVKTLEGRE